jgi:hypothetical protein
VIELVTRRLLSNISVDEIPSKLIKSHNIRDRLTAGLNTELLIVVSDREMLSIYSCKRNSKLVGVDLSQLRNVSGIGAPLVEYNFIVHFFNYVYKSLEIRYAQVSTDCFVDQYSAGINRIVELSQRKCHVILDCIDAL